MTLIEEGMIIKDTDGDYCLITDISLETYEEETEDEYEEKMAFFVYSDNLEDMIRAKESGITQGYTDDSWPVAYIQEQLAQEKFKLINTKIKKVKSWRDMI